MWRQAQDLAEFLREAECWIERPCDFETHQWLEMVHKVLAALDPLSSDKKPWQKVIYVGPENDRKAFLSLNVEDPEDRLLRLLRAIHPNIGRV
jgi:hypothetical protein